MYIHKDYIDTIDYNFKTNTYTIVKYNNKISESTVGFADILNGKFLAWFFHQEILYLATDKVQIPFKDIELEFVSKDINDDRLQRKLIIKKDSIVMDTIEYTIDKKIIEQQIMYTEMAEVEDWDLGLQIINIFNDKSRQVAMLEINIERNENQISYKNYNKLKTAIKYKDKNMNWVKNADKSIKNETNKK